MYNKGWEGNMGHHTIDQADHGEFFLPFVRARGSWFKWFFIKGASEISYRNTGVLNQDQNRFQVGEFPTEQCTIDSGNALLCDIAKVGEFPTEQRTIDSGNALLCDIAKSGVFSRSETDGQGRHFRGTQEDRCAVAMKLPGHNVTEAFR
jgi:hypothetical protein